MARRAEQAGASETIDFCSFGQFVQGSISTWRSTFPFCDGFFSLTTPL
jgi:hypothetical protein